MAAVIAIEPEGPPCGTALNTKGGFHHYTPFITYDHAIREYGLADIPLNYHPPVRSCDMALDESQSPLDLVQFCRATEAGECVLQAAVEGSRQFRQLWQLAKVPHAVVTAHASSHSVYDWATVSFMKQAGLNVKWIRLEDLNIRGNGHLMFLETNSNAIADIIRNWISKAVELNNRTSVDGDAPPQLSHSSLPAKLFPIFKQDIDTTETIEEKKSVTSDKQNPLKRRRAKLDDYYPKTPPDSQHALLRQTTSGLDEMDVGQGVKRSIEDSPTL